MMTEQEDLSSGPGTAVAASGSKRESIPMLADTIDVPVGLRRLSTATMNRSLKRILLSARGYPNGTGGRLYSSVPPGRAPFPREHKAGRVYRLIFDGGASGLVTGVEEAAVGMPLELEATRDDSSGALMIRELTSLPHIGGKSSSDESGNRTRGDIVARIECSVQVASGREADYRVVLVGCKSEGEVMSVRVLAHPKTTEAPRETQAVLLLPQQSSGEDIDWIPAWKSSRAANPPGGLWEAVASGRIDAESVVKLRNKKPIRSSTTGGAFELDLLEAWRPGRISAGHQQIPSSQSAPETIQMMVTVSRQGYKSTSARSGGSSSFSAQGDDKRLPVLQLIRMKGRGSYVEDDNGDDGCDFHWRVALTAPMPALYGFCLAVVGLETRVVGSSVAVVDRAAVVEGQAEAAAGFLGFEKALILHSAPTLKLDPRLPQSFKGDVPSSVRTSKRDVYLAKDAVGSASGTDGIDAKYRTNGDGSGSLVPEYGIGVVETASRCGEQNGKTCTQACTDDTQAEASTDRGADNRTWLIPVKRKMSMKIAAAKIVDKVYRNTYVCNMCLSTVIVSFAADLYPGVPSHNTPLSTALLWASCNVDTVRPLRRRFFIYTLSIMVLLSLFVDLDFLASPTRIYALAQLEEEDDDLQRVVLSKHMHTFARITVGILATLKALSWQGLLATYPQGVHALNLLWRRFKLFLPIWGSPRKLTKEVYNRIVALAWIHLLAAMTLVTLAGVTALGFEWAPQFASAQGAGAPLAAICFLKSTTDLLIYAALFRNIDLAHCLNVFGCLACFQDWHRAREERRRARHGVTYPKVVLEWDYIMLCSYIKILDLLVGLWMWIGLGWAWSEDLDYSGRYSIRILLIAITTVQTLTDIWSVFLGITVCLLVSQYLLRKENMTEARRQAFGDGANGDVEIARSLTAGRPMSPLPLNPEASMIEGRSGTEDGLESDEDSYSTGNSETGDNSNYDRTDHVSDRKASGIDIRFQTPSPAAFVQARAIADGDTAMSVRCSVATSEPVLGPVSSPRRWSGNHLVYKRAFSARSSSDDIVPGNGNHTTPIPEAVILDRDLTITPEEFNSAWESLETCANFRCRISRLPEIEAVASHLREQGFLVVARGVMLGKSNVHACARGVGLTAIFFVELVFENEMHELEFTFKCHDERLKALFACHMHLRRIIGDHQPIA